MAGVCFFILVALSVGHVFAETRNCSEAAIVARCDECIRCGGRWCLDRDAVPRCSYSDNDNWCSNVLRIEQTSGSDSDYKHIKQLLRATSLEQIQIPESYDEPQIIFVKSSMKNVTGLEGKIDIEFEDLVTLSVTPTKDFCPAQGKIEESLTIKIEDKKWGDAKTILVTFLVPCACSCSSVVEKKSQMCSGRGNYSCGICTCEQGWKGEACELKEVIGGSRKIEDGDKDRRGDVPECENQYGKICSENGKCEGGKCICDMSIEGSQYFGEQCMDICLSISSFADNCIIEPPVRGVCKYNENIFIDELNRTRLSEENSSGMRTWVNCTEVTESCEIKYAAMRDSTGITHVMFLDLCNAILGARVALNLAWPVGLGVIGVIAAASAVAGFMLWKNRAPPLPLNDPGYGKIDAEDCTGMNPLYKPPTSSFKNPTYGKW